MPTPEHERATPGAAAALARLAMKVATLSVSNVVSIAIGLALVPLQARLLDPAIWGAAQLATRLSDLGSALVLPGLAEAASQSGARKCHGNYAAIRALRFRTASRVAIAMALAGAAHVYAGQRAAGLMILAWSAAFQWLMLGLGIPDSWLAALGEVHTLTQLRVLQSCCALAAALGVLLAPESWTYGLFVLAGSLAGSLLGDWYARGACRNDATDPALVQLGLKMSGPQLFANVVNCSEPVVLSWVLGLRGLAAWLAAMTLSRYAKVVQTNLLIALQPRFYADEPWDRKLEGLLPWIRGYCAATLFACAALLLFGEQVIALLLGARWQDSAKLGALLTGAYLVVSVTDFYAAMIVARRDFAFNRWFSTVTPVVSMAGAVGLGLHAGLPGVVLSRILTWIVIAAVRLAFMLRHGPGSPPPAA